MKPILILAAGASRRMGGVDKLLQKVNDVPLLVRTVRIACASGHPVFVAIPGPWHPRYKILKDEEATCFDVPDAEEGVGGTLRGAVKRLPPCDAFMIMLADMPLIEAHDVRQLWLAAAAQDQLITRATTDDGKLGHPIIFDSQLRDAFENLHGDEGAKAIAQQNISATRYVPLTGHRARFDLDTPEDWKNLPDIPEPKNLVDVPVK